MTCARVFEAEAMRDGRLGDRERVSFERHLVGCADCAREVKALNRLATSLRQEDTDEEAAGNELHIRRERTRLLAAFDESLVATPVETRSRLKRWMLVPALAIALLILFVVSTKKRSTTTSTTTTTTTTATAAAPAIVATPTLIHGGESAIWSNKVDGASHRNVITLNYGALWIHVDHVARGEGGAAIVMLPDGELEDTGTTFTVRVENGHTTHVGVEEGSVVLRLRGQAPITISAQTEWRPPQSPSSASTSSSSAPAAKLLATDSSSAEFRDAMGALNDGDNGRAAARFDAFASKHPQDPRTEDAMYLRVIAFQRSNDDAKMRAAAIEYLRRYPAGFRRAEVEPLSR